MAETLPFPLLLLAFFYLTAYCTLHCLRQSPHFPILYPPVFDDCLKLAEFIISGDKAEAPITFSRNPELGFPVPYSWDYLPGTCMVHIGMMSNADEDTFAMTWIAFKVADIVEACMLDLKMPGLGGHDLVGPKQRMKVFVEGRPWPKARNYSHHPIDLNNIDLGSRLKTLRTALESSRS